MLIDYSQYSKWNFCPWAWYENYVNQRQKPWVGQRRDPLCLGTLVHNAMDNFAKTGKPSIDEETLLEVTPTPDTYEMAILLVNGYLKRYPGEIWPLERAEQPLKFSLGHPTRDDGTEYTIDGLAKLDGYFYVPEDATIESGIPGEHLTLSRGWYSKEYKTKAHGIKRATWIQEWQTKRQADFQILALQEFLRNAWKEGKYPGIVAEGDVDNVRGVLVCVLEKPYEYVPERKCVGCGDKYELAAFMPKPDGYMCPMCGKIQQLNPYKPKTTKTPDYFRVLATRTPERLEIAKQEILQVALAMEEMRARGMDSVLPNRDACVNNVHRHECSYFGPHTYGGETSDAGAGFVQIDSTKYMGVTV